MCSIIAQIGLKTLWLCSDNNIPIHTPAPTPIQFVGPTPAPAPIQFVGPTPAPTPTPTPIQFLGPTPVPIQFVGPTPAPIQFVGPTPAPTPTPTPIQFVGPTPAPTPIHFVAPTPAPTPAFRPSASPVEEPVQLLLGHMHNTSTNSSDDADSQSIDIKTQPSYELLHILWGLPIFCLMSVFIMRRKGVRVAHILRRRKLRRSKSWPLKAGRKTFSSPRSVSQPMPKCNDFDDIVI